MERLLQTVSDFDTLKLDCEFDDIPALIRAIHSKKETLNGVIVQMPFPLYLNENQRACLLEAIGFLPELEKLNMECYDLGRRALEDFIASIQRTRPPCKDFGFWDVQLVDESITLDPLVMTLSSFPTLEKVALGVAGHSNRHVLNESSLVVLCHNPRLTDLRLANLQLDLKRVLLVTEALEMNNGSLKYLEVHGEHLETEGWLAIARMLERNKSLQKFSLFDFKGLGDTGAVALAKAVGCNKTLRSLSIENEDDTVTTQGNIAIAQMLQNNRTLLSVCFSSKGLNDDACLAYAAALERNGTLKDLELGTYQGGRVGSRGVSAIANILPQNHVLEKLCLCCQQGLDDQGAIAVANGLQSNNSLKHLLLEDDHDAVTAKGYEALVQMLRTNTVLETIYHENAGNLRQKMAYYLKLNQRGIRNLQLNVNVTRDQFLDAIVSHQEDLDCLYYLVLINPSFCYLTASHRNGWL